MSNLSTFRVPNLKTANGALTYSANNGVVSYVAPTKLSQFTNDVGFIGSNPPSFEIGSLTAVNTPYIDFHSSGGANDWDARLIASGGSNSVNNAGTLSMYGANMVFNAPVSVGAGQTGQNNFNLTLSETGHATSRRAMMQVGTGWQMGQDSGTNGYRDFFLYNANTANFAYTVNPINNNIGFGGNISASNATFTGNVSVNPSLNIYNSNSACLIYTDVGSNNFVVRTGIPGSFKYFACTASGDFSVNNGSIYAVGSVNGTGGNFSADVHTSRGNTNTGYYYMGNTNNNYLGFDGNAMYLRAGAGGNVYRNTDAANYVTFDSCSLWGTTRSWYGTTSAVLGSSPVTQAPALNLGTANTGIPTSTGGYGAIRIQSYDTGSNSGAYLEFLNQGRYGAYLGLDSDNQLKFGGWSAGNNAYRVHHFGNCNPVIDFRLIFAGDQSGASINSNVGSNATWEPYAGALVSGGTTAAINGTYAITGLRWRYAQKQDAYGNWYTVAYG